MKQAYIHFINVSSEREPAIWKAEYITANKDEGPFYYFQNSEKDLPFHHSDVIKLMKNCTSKHYRNIQVSGNGLGKYFNGNNFAFNGRTMTTPHNAVNQGGMLSIINLNCLYFVIIIKLNIEYLTNCVF